MTSRYTEMQLDALRELANVASGTAATALSQMVGREIGLTVPRAQALSFADAIRAAGEPEETVYTVALALVGGIGGLVALLIGPTQAATLCELLGVEPGSEVGDSALSEIGNILGASFLNAIGSMTGVALEPGPPELSTGLVGTVVAALLARTTDHGDTALMLDSEIDVAGESCSISFMLLPNAAGVTGLLAPLGLA